MREHRMRTWRDVEAAATIPADMIPEAERAGLGNLSRSTILRCGPRSRQPLPTAANGR